MTNTVYKVSAYKIEEYFDSETMKAYFLVYYMMPTPSIIGPKFDTLAEAEECVRMCMKDVYY
jgi:hypothetical protein